ncbi:MAG: DUF202 domain-containing protein [Rhodopirellula sp. JB053]|uniref:DUF202 domain-containing protein n=1 Tax=Rhodopirellula sp. JB044 TaxID=3342844 RepID=UPI00370AE7B9
MTTSLPDPTPPPDRRNELAVIRTDLANERTLLAYGRTALMMAGTGGTLIKFFGESPDMLVLGILLLILGVVMFGTGIIRFQIKRKQISGRV